MATVRFLTKGRQNPNTIYIRLRDGRTIDITTSTGLTVDPDHWSKSKQWIIPKADFHNKQNLEKDLRKLETLLHNERNAHIAKGLPINRDWLDNLIHKWQGRELEGVTDHLIQLMDKYKSDLPNRIRNGKKGVSAGAIRNYNTTIQRLKKFEKATSKYYRVVDVDLTFHGKYIKFATNKLGLALNSIGKDITQIKTICLDARDKGISINEQVLSRKFSSPSEKTLFTTINRQELKLIEAFTGVNHLENARDWLIIGCWTGCRVGDLMKLTMDNINIHKSGNKVIQYTQSKTDKLVNVPMHHNVQHVIDRLGGFPRSISPEKFNAYIKTVCKNSGLTYTEHGTRQNPETHRRETGNFEKWQLIKSHTCRRSFATNHYNDLTNKQIMAVTGHSTEKMLMSYIGETEIDHVEDFMDLWGKQEESLSIKLQSNEG
jgi:integrase